MESAGTLGERIRRLRLERGLSLAKVARGDFSRAFLNQVEMGKSRPSPRSLAVIAARLGTSAEYLQEGSVPGVEREIAVERARILLAEGHPRLALNEVKPYLDSAEWPVGGDARLCAAEALLELGARKEAKRMAEAELANAGAWLDEWRVMRWRSVREGWVRRPGAAKAHLALREHERAGDRLFRYGRPLAALEHYRAARAIAEATHSPVAFRNRRVGELPPEPAEG